MFCLFILNIYCLLIFVKKEKKYALRFNDRPVKALSIQTYKIAHILNEKALEQRKRVYRFDRKTFDELLYTKPVLPN